LVYELGRVRIHGHFRGLRLRVQPRNRRFRQIEFYLHEDERSFFYRRIDGSSKDANTPLNRESIRYAWTFAHIDIMCQFSIIADIRTTVNISITSHEAAFLQNRVRSGRIKPPASGERGPEAFQQLKAKLNGVWPRPRPANCSMATEWSKSCAT